MTQTNRTKQTDSSNVIEDLTLDETKSENVKGGGDVNASYGIFVDHSEPTDLDA